MFKTHVGIFFNQGTVKLMREKSFFVILQDFEFYRIDTRGQFHHFMSSFCANFLAPKKYKPTM